MNKIVCITGLVGTGKSLVSERFLKKDFSYIRFGQITIDELVKRGLEINEKNERAIRVEFRKEHGMAAYATLNLSKFRKLLKNGNVVADGLYSFAEYKALKKGFKKQLVVVAVYSSPETRYKRVAGRKERPLKLKEAETRDLNEIEQLDKGGTIAMADYTIVNEGSKRELYGQVEEILKKI